MDRHPLLLVAAVGALLAVPGCGSGDADAHQTSASPATDRAEPEGEFHDLAARYESRDGRAQRPEVRRELATYGSRAVTWASNKLASSRDEVPYAELISAAATRDDANIVRRALGASRDAMARHRLATTLIELGDLEPFAVLLEGLESANSYDRSDAAAMLAEVAHSLPAELRPKAVTLLRAGLAEDAGGVTARGYSKSLRVLGAE